MHHALDRHHPIAPAKRASERASQSSASPPLPSPLLPPLRLPISREGFRSRGASPIDTGRFTVPIDTASALAAESRIAATAGIFVSVPPSGHVGADGAALGPFVELLPVLARVLLELLVREHHVLAVLRRVVLAVFVAEPRFLAPAVFSLRHGQSAPVRLLLAVARFLPVRFLVRRAGWVVLVREVSFGVEGCRVRVFLCGAVDGWHRTWLLFVRAEIIVVAPAVVAVGFVRLQLDVVGRIGRGAGARGPFVRVGDCTSRRGQRVCREWFVGNWR